MKYDKTFYILNRDGWDAQHPYYIEPVKACNCPYDDRLFIYKRENGIYVLTDKASGQSLKGGLTLKELKKWFIEKGKDAFERVMNNHLLDYDKRVQDYKRLLEAL